MLPDNIKWESAKRQALSLPTGFHYYLWQMLQRQEISFTLHVEFADTTPTSTDSTDHGSVLPGTE